MTEKNKYRKNKQIKSTLFIALNNSDSEAIQKNTSIASDTIATSFLVKPSSKRLQQSFPIDCFAIRLAQFLITTIKDNIFQLKKDDSFKDGFYKHCLKQIKNDDLINEIEDTELLEIYIKQTIVLLQESDFITAVNNVAKISQNNIKDHDLYFSLFGVFWNTVSWERIFPSDEILAQELKKSRYILIDLLLKNQKSIEISTLSNEFFELTGISSNDDLFTISFLDFYFFTWLKHFGIITYSMESAFTPVLIGATDKGRNLIKYII